MSFMVKLLLFVVFLIVYFLWSYATFKTTQKAQTDARRNRWFWASELMLILQVFIFIFIYLLSGSLNLPLAGAFLGAAQIAIVLTWVLLQFMGEATTNWRQRWQWAAVEVARNNQGLSVAITVLSFLVFLAYPIIAGVIQFKHARPSPELSEISLKWTIAFIGMGSYPLVLFYLIGGLASENLDDDTRERVFVTQLSGVLQLALLLSLTFWAFGIAGGGVPLELGGVSISFSPKLVIVLISYVVLVILFPFLAGARRSKKKRMALMARRKHWLDKVFGILDVPNPKAYETKLNQMRSDIEADSSKLKDNDVIVASGVLIDSGQKPDGMPPEFIDAYTLTREMDPRFVHLDWLQALSEEVALVIDHLKQAASDPERVQLAQDWSENFNSRREDLEVEIKETKKGKPSTLVAVAFLLTPILTVVLGKIGEAIWAGFSKSMTP